MDELTISLLQMDIALGDPKTNFAHVEAQAARAAARSLPDTPHLLLLPELWSTAYDLARAAELAWPLEEEVDDAALAAGNAFARVADLARSHNLWIAGSMLELSGGRHFNCLTLYGPDGRLSGLYRKVHLFRLMQEEQYLAPGPALAAADTPWGPTGLSICYDLRFPELYRRAALGGARLLLVPAEWPNPRRSHWRTLLRARAIENQCFVAACNRVGPMRDATFFGASALIDPWGETVIEGDESGVLLTATINLSQSDEVRRKIPVFADRRADLYG
jgi:predicted amidohydrolase